MENVVLRTKTIHFGYGHILPLTEMNRGLIRQIEENLEYHGFQIMGNNIQDSALAEIRTKHGDDEFLLKLQRVGQLQSATPEPLYAIVGIVQQSGNPERMNELYSSCTTAIRDSIGLPATVIAKEATVKRLYGPIDKVQLPAFQYLWEKVLGQSEEQLKAFGSAILGGGLRFVVVPHSIDENTPELVGTEFKIESFLQDTRFLYVETKYEWRQPAVYQEPDKLTSIIGKNVSYVLENSRVTVKNYLGGNVI